MSYNTNSYIYFKSDKLENDQTAQIRVQIIAKNSKPYIKKIKKLKSPIS